MKSVLIGFLKRQKSPPLPGNVRIGKICRKKNYEIINYEMARANASLSRHKRAKKKTTFITEFTRIIKCFMYEAGQFLQLKIILFSRSE